MKIHYTLESLPHFRNPVVTVGVFDGVHLGHIKVIEQLVDYAHKKEGESILLTFNPHPQEVLHPRPDFFLINTIEERISLLSRTGIDHLIVVPFTVTFSQLTYEQFIREILIGKIRAKAIVMGPNHSFGKNREGHFDNITDLCRQCEVDVVEIPEFISQDIAVRSSKIRHYITEGNLQKAEELLGHPIHNH